MIAVLSPAEYDFRSVPDSSLRDCCLYEYLREGELQRWQLARKFKAEVERSLRRRSVYPDATTAVCFLISRLPSKWFGIANGGLAKPFVSSPPWLELNAEQQSIASIALNAFGRGRPVIPEIYPVRTGDLSVWLGGQVLVDAASSHANPSQEKPIEDALAMDGGSVYVALRLNLKGATDDEILQVFKNHLAELRTRFDIKKPQKVGHSFERQRKLLDNLGILRLRHTLPRHQVAIALSKIEIHIGGQSADSSEITDIIDKRASTAIAHFHEDEMVSGDLPDDARPASQLTQMQVANAKPIRGVAPVTGRGPVGQNLL